MDSLRPRIGWVGWDGASHTMGLDGPVPRGGPQQADPAHGPIGAVPTNDVEASYAMEIFREAFMRLRRESGAGRRRDAGLLELHYRHGLKAAQIATLLACPAIGIEERLRRGRGRLRRHLLNLLAARSGSAQHAQVELRRVLAALERQRTSRPG